MDFLFVQYRLYGQIYQHSHQHKKFRRDKVTKKHKRKQKKTAFGGIVDTHSGLPGMWPWFIHRCTHTGKQARFHSDFLSADICMEKHPIILDYKRSAEAVSSCSFTIIPQRELGCLKASRAFLHLSSPLKTRPGFQFKTEAFKFTELYNYNVSATLD